MQYGGAHEEFMNWIDGGRQERKLSLRVNIGWEKDGMPVRAYLEFTSVVDDQGDEHTNGFQQNGKFKLNYADDIRILKETSRRLTLAPASTVDLKPEAKRVSSFRGKAVLYLRAHELPFEILLAADKAESSATLEVVDDRFEEAIAMPAIVHRIVRTGDEVACTVQFNASESRLGWDLVEGWVLRDDAGRRYEGAVGARGISDESATFDLKFRGVPREAVLQSVETALPRRLIRKEIPFEMKDVRIR